MNEQQRHEQRMENTTKSLSSIVSSPAFSSSSSVAPDRARTVINVIYVLGIVFMLIVFLVLLWINLYSRRCWCWHDTPLIHRFNRQWLIKRSIRQNPTRSPIHHRPERTSLHDEELQTS